MTLIRTILVAALLAACVTSIGCAAPTGRGVATSGAPDVAGEGSATATSGTSPTWPPSIALQPAWNGFDRPVYLTGAGDGSGRAFVVELRGVVRVIRDGKLLERPFLDVSRLVSTGVERGCFTIAFAPDYVSTGRFYVDYTDLDGNSVVARYRVSSTDRDVADPASARVLLHVTQPFANHNGGQLAFGPDGYLYVGFGDGGGGGDPHGNGQNPGTLLGKILRLDVSGPDGYLVPASNPFVATKGFRPEIWDLGLRNPWRFSFDPGTGDLYIGDVGQNAWEEIDFEPTGSGGHNYGWNRYEGTHPYPPGSSSSPAGLTMPVAEYGHDQGAAVTGGYVYRGSRWPALDGVYFFGDYGSGRVWALARVGGTWSTAVVAESAMSIASFGRDESGDLYVLDFAGGRISRIVAR